jgi:hypothetical protein
VGYTCPSSPLLLPRPNQGAAGQTTRLLGRYGCAHALLPSGARRRRRGQLVRWCGRGRLVETTELNTARLKELLGLCEEGRISAVGGNDAEAAKRVYDELDDAAGSAPGVYARLVPCAHLHRHQNRSRAAPRRS